MTKETVAITLGNNTELQICDDDHLYLVHDAQSSDPTYISLGLATKDRFTKLSQYLDRLSIHAVDV
jgi:hypothetical protein